ncbi:MAG: PKD domain-containing protein [Methanosarcinaceae archaeon]|nr:PKD domain-containing protein [Methanosarcinaceae archaeon]
MKGKRRKIRILSLVIIFALLALITVGCASGAPPKEAWNQTFGGTDEDWAHSVQQTSDGGYILTGVARSYGAGESDFWLVKTYPDGNEQWNKTFGGTDSDLAYSVQQTSDGGYILAGYTWSYGAGGNDFWLVKADSDGNEQWNKTFGGTNFDSAHSVQQTSDGGYILAGRTTSYGAGGSDFWLVKTDPDGNKQWEKTFGGTDYDSAHSVQQTSDGGYILAGSTNSYGAGESDFWLVKTDPNGNEQWNKTFGSTDYDSAHSVQQTSDGGYILAGEHDFWLVKTDPDGNEQWNKTLGGNYFTKAHSVQQTADGGYILAGTTGSRGSSVDLWLVKTDPDGNKQWDKTLGGKNSDRAYSIQQTSDGGYILAGSTNSSGASRSDFWLIKIEREGPTPTAFFTHIPRYPGVNETIIFDASFSYDSDGNITNYKWDFGDGNIINTAEMMITHSYALEGDYNVNLTVIDNDGLVNSTSKAVKVLMSPLLEEWNRTFGGAYDDRAWSVQQTSDGGYILAGRLSYDTDLYDFWLVKADSDGNEQWNKTFGNGTKTFVGLEWPQSVQQTTDGGYILADYMRSYGAGGSTDDFWLVKADSDGNEQWNKTFDGKYYDSQDIAKSVKQTSDGGYILAGDTLSHDAFTLDFWLVKADSDGNEQWNKTFGGWGFDSAYSVQQTSDGGYILAGAWSYGYELYDFWLVKTDPDGNEQWNKTFGGEGFDYAYSVQQTSDGGYILAGYTNSYGAGGNDFWLVKTDSNGNEQWNRTIGGANDDRAYSVWQTTDRGYILAGYTRSYGAGKGDFWLVKTDPDGYKQWDKTFGGTDHDWAHSVQQTSDGGYILAGYTNSYGAGGNDFWLIKVGRDPIESDSELTIPEVPTEEDKRMPGFELIFGIAGLLAVIYLFNRKNQR